MKYKNFEYTIKYQKRKTIGAYFQNGDIIEIRAPQKLSESELINFFDTYSERLKACLSKQREIVEKKQGFTFGADTELYLFGKKYPISQGESKTILFENGEFYIPQNLSVQRTAALVLDFYRRASLGYITERCEYLANKLNIKVDKIRITAAKTCWGSCSGKNSINFSERLCMASKDDIDYVIIHELSHTVFHNHSPSFYALVKSIKPDYEKNRANLKALSKRLQTEFPF